MNHYLIEFLDPTTNLQKIEKTKENKIMKLKK